MRMCFLSRYNSNLFSDQRFCVRTRFETRLFGNGLLKCIFLCALQRCLHTLGSAIWFSYNEYKLRRGTKSTNQAGHFDRYFRKIHCLTRVFHVKFLNRIAKATWTKPNIFNFCEPCQSANNGNPFKVNVNAFSRTFECEWFPQIF